jgi:hypothetical protein
MVSDTVRDARAGLGCCGVAEFWLGHLGHAEIAADALLG